MRKMPQATLWGLGLLLALGPLLAQAQDGSGLRPIRRLNTAPFYLGVQDQTELVQVINRYAEDIRQGLSMAGYPQLSDAVIGEIRDGRITVENLEFGQRFYFMLFRHIIGGRDQDTGRRFKKGEVDVVRDLYWANDASIQAYILKVEDQSRQYTFAIPFGTKGCTNLTLIDVKAFPVCQLRVSPKPAVQGVPVTIDASGSYVAEGTVSTTVTVTDSNGSVLTTRDGGRPFDWTCQGEGTYVIRAQVTTEDGLTAECMEQISCEPPPPPPNEPPRCLMVVSTEQPLTGQEITIDATAASDPENCIQSNVVEIKDAAGQVILSTSGEQLVFYKFKRRGTYTIANTVTDCEGEVSYCEKSVVVTRKKGRFSLAVGAMYERRLGSEEFSEIFDIGLVVETDPWPNTPFVRATVLQLSQPANSGAPSYSIQLFRTDGGSSLIGESNSGTVFEMMLPGAGSYEVVARGQLSTPNGTVSDEETVAFTIEGNTTDSFNVNAGNTTVTSSRSAKESNWYLPVKVGYTYELVSNLEAALYGGVAIALNDLDESALFADLELNYQANPVMFGIGLGWWDITDRSAIELLLNAGVKIGEGILGTADRWTLFVQGRLPFESFDALDEDFRILFGIRIDF